MSFVERCQFSARDGLSYGGAVVVRVARVDRSVLLAIDLSIRINEIIQRIALLLRTQDHIPALGELHAILVVRAEKVFAPVGILGGFRGIHRDPADSLGVEFGPAM